jgi:hypothetical protein
MGFPKLGGAFYTEAIYEFTENKRNNLGHAPYGISQCQPHHSQAHNG